MMIFPSELQAEEKMKYTDNALNILAAKTFHGIGDAWINKNLITLNTYSPKDIVELLKRTVKQEDVSEEIFWKRRENIEKRINCLGKSCDGIVALGDPQFPSYRGKVRESEKPNVLFYKGCLDLLDIKSKNVSVIGLLTPDLNIESDERKIVKHLVENNIVIVSGLAIGCDFIAHHQTVDMGGRTIAILPSPLNNILPVKNQELSQEIVEKRGLLLTEYFDVATSPMELNSRYIRRDRLQALFSDLVLLSASYEPKSIDPKALKIDSGSRHAMEKAKEYGIPRSVIYHDDNKSNPKYDLNRKIINEDKNIIIINPKEPMSAIDKILNLFNEIKNKNDFLENSLSVDDNGQIGLF